MITIYLYGKLRQLAKKSAATDNSIIEMKWSKEMTVSDVLDQLQLTQEDVGEIFVNHTVVTDYSKAVPNESRVAIFAAGMHLLCGGQHLKGHGFISKKHKKLSYWNEENKTNNKEDEKENESK